ncbi:hypothetical protein SCNU_06370 [Gordonia neofelifaecis NRRL B-59395]|uniref:Uncharacterized protein n=1 Tax=Gordonia neofelifaecis NRRL B-59395 TaxID=644548 RepID=F1YHK6_9ACTN|nr:hypothetical protein SCNU_06370 [Gordonia neofelifaecis NRRL B-59395]
MDGSNSSRASIAHAIPAVAERSSCRDRHHRYTRIRASAMLPMARVTTSTACRFRVANGAAAYVTMWPMKTGIVNGLMMREAYDSPFIQPTPNPRTTVKKPNTTAGIAPVAAKTPTRSRQVIVGPSRSGSAVRAVRRWSSQIHITNGMAMPAVIFTEMARPSTESPATCRPPRASATPAARKPIISSSKWGPPMRWMRSIGFSRTSHRPTRRLAPKCAAIRGTAHIVSSSPGSRAIRIRKMPAKTLSPVIPTMPRSSSMKPGLYGEVVGAQICAIESTIGPGWWAGPSVYGSKPCISTEACPR